MARQKRADKERLPGYPGVRTGQGRDEEKDSLLVSVVLPAAFGFVLIMWAAAKKTLQNKILAVRLQLLLLLLLLLLPWQLLSSMLLAKVLFGLMLHNGIAQQNNCCKRIFNMAK